jgi:hypothetical protein
MCDVDGTDPYTAATKLCDDDGIVRGGAMHHGTDYVCTGHAHFGGEHIRCTSPAHAPMVLDRGDQPAGVRQLRAPGRRAAALHGDPDRPHVRLPVRDLSP